MIDSLDENNSLYFNILTPLEFYLICSLPLLLLLFFPCSLELIICPSIDLIWITFALKSKICFSFCDLFSWYSWTLGRLDFCVNLDVILVSQFWLHLNWFSITNLAYLLNSIFSFTTQSLSNWIICPLRLLLNSKLRLVSNKVFVCWWFVFISLNIGRWKSIISTCLDQVVEYETDSPKSQNQTSLWNKFAWISIKINSHSLKAWLPFPTICGLDGCG